MTSSDKALPSKRIIWFSISITLFVIIIWLRFRHLSTLGTQNALNLGAEFLAFGLLSFALAKSLNNDILADKHLYRAAFLTALGLGFVLFLATRLFFSDDVFFQYLPLVTFSSFGGSFIASNLAKGWWENNAPPTPQIESDVLTWHQTFMGRPISSHTKRLVDIFLSLFSLIISMPIWLLIVFLIWWEEPGPVIFIKNAVGLGGRNFKQFKFRSMVTNAEKETGPISGYEDDERVLFIGKFLRKTALDELPQLLNILMGDMSYVGPRPQRTILVHGYLQDLPEYAARHRVRPGLSGLAQVTDSYSITPEEKLAWDLIYIDRMNIGLDFKLAFAAFLLVFVLRWRVDTDPTKIIRGLLKVEKPSLDRD